MQWEWDHTHDRRLYIAVAQEERRRYLQHLHREVNGEGAPPLADGVVSEYGAKTFAADVGESAKAEFRKKKTKAPIPGDEVQVPGVRFLRFMDHKDSQGSSWGDVGLPNFRFSSRKSPQ